MKKLFAIFYLTSLFACSQQHSKHVASQKVKCYKQHVTNSDGSCSLLFWYMIMTANNQCYYYSSPTEITNYSTISWQSSNISPIIGMDEKQFEQMPEQEVSMQEMSQEMQVEMMDNAENFGGMTTEEMGDYEGGGQDNSASESSSDNSSDGGSSDGGGDSGGGDGGGGE